ncbi:MaoC/PaaZ C-terminal domain-containing protein [Nocardioides sp. CN2-186]|uniref:MaoC/PaaZ C-terminal domain-containing protein n=1 Tax=Nocardioides tweenelious TaxID=3156607 RepID=UPI0032B4D2E1
MNAQSVIAPAPLVCEPISRTTLALFAGASGDHNPIHIDLDVARSAGLDDVFAQGMLSMAYLARCVTEAVPQHQLRTLTTRFVAITPLHARPTCTAHVRGVADDVATLDLAVTLDDGTLTLTGTATVALA